MEMYGLPLADAGELLNEYECLFSEENILSFLSEVFWLESLIHLHLK